MLVFSLDSPKDRDVHLTTIGGNADQMIGKEVQNFLIQNGYSVRRTMKGMTSDMPAEPFTLSVSKDGLTFITVAPSAR